MHQHESSAVSELQQFLSAPRGGSPSQSHHHASTVMENLQALRDAGDKQFLFTRSILELAPSTSLRREDEELLFHCITGCRHVILTKWPAYSPTFRRALRDYFFIAGIMMHNTSNRTIRLAYWNASASFWKRCWVEDLQSPTPTAIAPQTSSLPPPSPQEQVILEQISLQTTARHLLHLESPIHLFQHLQQMLLGDAPLPAASFLLVLIGEFAGGKSYYNMPLEFHKRAHSAFELGINIDATTQAVEGFRPLHQCLQMSMTALSRIVSNLNQKLQQQQQNNSSLDHDADTDADAVTLAILQLTTDVIAWEWGTEAWDSTGMAVGTRALVRPPLQWRDMLLQPDFINAMFQVHRAKLHHASHNMATNEQLLHALRQLLLLLTSLTGSIFHDNDERKFYGRILLEGILQMLQTPGIANKDSSHALLIDSLSMVSRLFINYKLSLLADSPHLTLLLQTVATIGRQLLQDNLQELQQTGGDFDLMQERDWREEAIQVLVDALILLCGDPWLLYSGSEEFRQTARAALAKTLGPLYVDFVTCRTQMARLEEMHFTAHDTDLDEVREEIFAVGLEEEMTALATIGRLDLLASLECLSNLFHHLVPQIQALWDGNVGVVTPQAAGLLEESRLVIMYVGHLLTDDNDGETPVIPDTIMVAGQQPSHQEVVTQAIIGAVHTVRDFAHYQVTKIMQHPADPRLSPLLAKSFLWFFHRWAPAYILPVVDYQGADKDGSTTTIATAWTSPDRVNDAVSFVITLCVHYHCYWPQERQVQEKASILLHDMAKRCKSMRLAMMNTPAFRQLISFHCLTSGIRHSASSAEFESIILSKVGNEYCNVEMLRGYQRLPYDIKSKILTGILVGCSEHGDVTSKKYFEECLGAVREPFSALVNALSSKEIPPTNMDAKEMASLCVELYGGVARAGEMVASERISKFLTPSFPHLSGLMAFYADDLSICESLLRLFRDYAEQFIAVLDPASCVALFQASGELLRSYSAVHCLATRVIVHSAEEEQSYNDILCAIQLLIQLGTKDFIQLGGDDPTGMNSSQVTDMIFFGLQQILPLMTRGLLQFPTLCTQYFSLVGFMMETYPDKVRILPYELFDALLDSLLFGMSYHDVSVAKCSLQGLAGIMKEHLQHRVLDVQLNKNPDLLDKCSHRLLVEVVFQNCIWDRIEATGMALLPLAASDLNRFAGVVQRICQQIPAEHQPRLSRAFELLLQPEVLSKILAKGYEGRQTRIKFKEDFENFCHEVHSFLVLK